MRRFTRPPLVVASLIAVIFLTGCGPEEQLDPIVQQVPVDLVYGSPTPTSTPTASPSQPDTATPSPSPSATPTGGPS